MKTKKINGIEVIECNHCDGTGTCQKARKREILKKTFIGMMSPDKTFYECSVCGTGQVQLHIPEEKTEATLPNCKVCGSKGYTTP